MHPSQHGNVLFVRIVHTERKYSRLPIPKFKDVSIRRQRLCQYRLEIETARCPDISSADFPRIESCIGPGYAAPFGMLANIRMVRARMKRDVQRGSQLKSSRADQLFETSACRVRNECLVSAFVDPIAHGLPRFARLTVTLDFSLAK